MLAVPVLFLGKPLFLLWLHNGRSCFGMSRVSVSPCPQVLTPLKLLHLELLDVAVGLQLKEQHCCNVRRPLLMLSCLCVQRGGAESQHSCVFADWGLGILFL